MYFVLSRIIICYYTTLLYLLQYCFMRCSSCQGSSSFEMLDFRGFDSSMIYRCFRHPVSRHLAVPVSAGERWALSTGERPECSWGPDHCFGGRVAQTLGTRPRVPEKNKTPLKNTLAENSETHKTFSDAVIIHIIGALHCKHQFMLDSMPNPGGKIVQGGTQFQYFAHLESGSKGNSTLS